MKVYSVLGSERGCKNLVKERAEKPRRNSTRLEMMVDLAPLARPN